MMHAIPDAPARGSAWPALDDLVTRLRAARRRIAAAQAEEAAVLAAAVELVAERVAVSRQEAQQQGRTLRMGDADLPVREVCLELGMAIRASDRGVQRRMSDAHQLKTSFSRTHAAWAAGEIDAGHAWAISRTGTMLTGDEDRARFEDRALEVARSESPTRAAPAITAIAASIDPAAFEQSARRGFDERSVRLFDLDDGMARLIADLPAPLAHAIHDALTTRARAILDREPEAEADAATPRAHADPDGGHDADEDAVVTGDGRGTGPGTGGRTGSRHGADARTLAQVRADVFSDLVLTGRPTTRATGDGLEAVAARIHVTIPALTLAGDPTGGPALLAGYGPIATSLARRLAGLAPGWDRIFTDPHTGEVRAVDRYRPSAELRRYLTARDEHCRTPGCTRPAQRCDIDHTTAAAQGGATAHDNLAHLCRRHHTTKHHTAWRVRHLGNGTLEWTSPAGHHYRDRPAATVRFVPTAEDPPPF
ncbi:HNH endonuclease [Microbacterium hominis]|uniref:HNH endonuclease n=2 Tax=Microbacteriaceae TaxID=85023 RepID=A0A2K9D5G7_9MICO|nr:HNH endonuclease [Microbacterium hominis]